MMCTADSIEGNDHAAGSEHECLPHCLLGTGTLVIQEDCKDARKAGRNV